MQDCITGGAAGNRPITCGLRMEDHIKRAQSPAIRILDRSARENGLAYPEVETEPPYLFEPRDRKDDLA